MSLNVPVLEQSFNLIEPRASEFADSFYATLFADCPEAMPLFANTNMEKQKQKLIMSLVYVITHLRYPDALSAALRDLGAKHVTHGATFNQYPVVGAALLKTLKSYLGENWTAEVERAWNDAYQAISDLMIEGAKEYEATLAPKESLSVVQEPPIEKKNLTQFKYIAAALGAAIALMFGFWLYKMQNNAGINTAPAETIAPSN
jgi:nitric oxide dioxygenase